VSMNRVIKTLGVPKSTLYYKPNAYPEGRKRTSRKQLADDAKKAILQLTLTSMRSVLIVILELFSPFRIMSSGIIPSGSINLVGLLKA
jgi:hypothetical protein